MTWHGRPDGGIKRAPRRSSSTATSRSRRTTRRRSRVASSSTSRYTRPTGCASRRRRRRPKATDEDLSELRPREPGRPRLLRVRRVPALGARPGSCRPSRPSWRSRRRGRAAAGPPPPPAPAAAAPRPPRRAAPPPRRPRPPRPPPPARRRPLRSTAPSTAAPPAPAGARPRREPEPPRWRRSRCACPTSDGRAGETLARRRRAGRPRARARRWSATSRGIVDNYELTSRACPTTWWSMLPDTVYLVPYGSGGTYEQEVEIHLHPPRSAEAEARVWELEVVADSKAQERAARGAPLLLRHPAVRGARHQGRARARLGPAQGALQGRGREQGERARRSSRSTGPRTRRRVPLRVRAAAGRDRARRDGRDDAGGPPAEADLDRPPARAPARGARRRPARRPRRCRRRRRGGRTRRGRRRRRAACAASASRASTGRGCYRPQVSKGERLRSARRASTSAKPHGPRAAAAAGRRRAA